MRRRPRPPDDPLVDLADLRDLGETLDDVQRPTRGHLVRRGNGHLAIVVDIDLTPGLVDDRANGLATGTDDVADLVLGNEHRV